MAPTSHLRLVPDDPGEELLAGGSDPALTIDCAICVSRHTDACDDCIVSYLVDHDADTPVVLDVDEQRAVDLLADAGLVPASRFRPRPGVA
jgi:hypothetical protein